MCYQLLKRDANADTNTGNPKNRIFHFFFFFAAEESEDELIAVTHRHVWHVAAPSLTVNGLGAFLCLFICRVPAASQPEDGPAPL